MCEKQQECRRFCFATPTSTHAATDRSNVSMKQTRKSFGHNRLPMPSATDPSTRPNFRSTFTVLFRSTCAIQLQQPDLWHLHGRSFSRVLAFVTAQLGSFLKLFQKRSQKALPRSRLMHPYRSDFPPIAVVAPIAYRAPSFRTNGVMMQVDRWGTSWVIQRQKQLNPNTWTWA